MKLSPGGKLPPGSKLRRSPSLKRSPSMMAAYQLDPTRVGGGRWRAFSVHLAIFAAGALLMMAFLSMGAVPDRSEGAKTSILSPGTPSGNGMSRRGLYTSSSGGECSRAVQQWGPNPAPACSSEGRKRRIVYTLVKSTVQIRPKAPIGPAPRRRAAGGDGLIPDPGAYRCGQRSPPRRWFCSRSWRWPP